MNAKTFGVVIAVVLLAACQQSPESGAVAAPVAAERAGATTPRHPLDPLTEDEIRVAIQTAKSDARLTGATFPSIALLDPSKAGVLAWQPGHPLARPAPVLAMTADRLSVEVVVDLTSRRSVSMVEEAWG